MENLSDVFDFLRDDEREVLYDILDEIKNIKSQSKEPKKVRSVVPIEKWIEDPYYVGPSGMALWPYWKAKMIEVFKDRPDGEEINEVIVDGGLGTGKSSFAVFCMVRKIYELSCYTNIPGLFQLMPGSIIALMYFSVSKTQAELTGYGQIKNIIDGIPYFQEKFKRNERLQSMVVFPENVFMMYGSDTTHAIGLNMIAGILDEANFRQTNAQIMDKASYDQSKVSTMYMSILNRGKSRFLSHGKNHSLVVLVSSNTTSSSFTEQRRRQARNDNHCLMVNARLWDVKPKGTYSDKGFWVFVGSDVLDPMVIETVEDIYQYTDSVNMPRVAGNIDDIINGLPKIHREMFTWVPEDFRKQYEDDIIQALQDLSGYSVAPSGRLFSSKPAYKEAIDTDVKSPFTKDIIMLSIQDKMTIDDYVKKNYVPLFRNKPRYIHIDQSLAHDRTGFASCFLHHWEKDESTGLYVPHYVFDILLSVVPPKPPRKISISKVFNIIYYMRDKWDLPIGYVSYDSYSSAGALQDLQTNGINCGLLSVDRDETQYMYLVNCLLHGQVKMYYHKIFEKEIFDLIYYRERHKVDHPQAYYGTGENANQTWGGSKDLTDACAGALWNCYQFSQSEAGQLDLQEIKDSVEEEETKSSDVEFSMYELTGHREVLGTEEDLADIIV